MTTTLLRASADILTALAAAQPIPLTRAQLSQAINPDDARTFLAEAALVALHNKVVLSGGVARLAGEGDEARPVIEAGEGWLSEEARDVELVRLRRFEADVMALLAGSGGGGGKGVGK